MENKEQNSSIPVEPKLTESEIKNITENAIIATEKELEQEEVDYLNEDFKSWKEVVIQLVIDYCIKNKISEPRFKTWELLYIVKNTAWRYYPWTFNKIPKSSVIQIITNKIGDTLIKEKNY